MWEYKVIRNIQEDEKDILLDQMGKDGWIVADISNEDSLTIVFKRPQRNAIVFINGYGYIVNGVVVREIVWLREQVIALLDLLNSDTIPPLPQPVYGVSPLLPFLEKFAALVVAAEDQEMLKESGLD